jgi:hypothetical protein
VWPGEIPPGWELEWVDDDTEKWHHRWPPVMLYYIAISTSAVFNKTLNHLLLCQSIMICNNGPYGQIGINL